METVSRKLNERLSIPIAILSFNRPPYLKQVLESLASQLVDGDEIYFFQDGGWNKHSELQKAEEETIDECINIFIEYFVSNKRLDGCRNKYARIFRSSENCGIAGNYRRAERYVFEVLNKKYALFLEDDLLIGQNYLLVISDLIDLALKNPRIGYVSAYGNLWATLAQQEAACGQLAQMHENWGAALTRDSWEAQKPIREQYWELVRDRDYSFRDHDAIRRFYEEKGIKCSITSQDASRWVAALEAGMVRITTATCHARYIGVVGEHSNQKWYDQQRFGMSEVFPKRPLIDMPTEREIEQWLRNDRAGFVTGYEHSYVANARIKALQEENDGLRHKVQSLSDGQISLVAEQGALRQELAQAQTRIKALEEENDDLRRQEQRPSDHQTALARESQDSEGDQAEPETRRNVDPETS